MNGGYFLIEETGIDLSITTKQTINGIYDSVKIGYRVDKPVYMGGCTIGTVAVSPINVNIRPGTGTNYIVRAGVLEMSVDSSDGVLVTTLIPVTPSNLKS